MFHLHLMCKQTGRNVFFGLSAGFFCNIDGRYLSSGKALGQHQCNHPRTCSDVKNTVSTTRPRPQQHAIGAYFHATLVLIDGKLLEFEDTVTHIPTLFNVEIDRLFYTFYGFTHY